MPETTMPFSPFVVSLSTSFSVILSLIFQIPLRPQKVTLNYPLSFHCYLGTELPKFLGTKQQNPELLEFLGLLSLVFLIFQVVFLVYCHPPLHYHVVAPYSLLSLPFYIPASLLQPSLLTIFEPPLPFFQGL